MVLFEKCDAYEKQHSLNEQKKLKAEAKLKELDEKNLALKCDLERVVIFDKKKIQDLQNIIDNNLKLIQDLKNKETRYLIEKTIKEKLFDELKAKLAGKENDLYSKGIKNYNDNKIVKVPSNTKGSINISYTLNSNSSSTNLTFDNSIYTGLENKITLITYENKNLIQILKHIEQECAELMIIMKKAFIIAYNKAYKKNEEDLENIHFCKIDLKLLNIFENCNDLDNHYKNIDNIFECNLTKIKVLFEKTNEMRDFLEESVHPLTNNSEMLNYFINVIENFQFYNHHIMEINKLLADEIVLLKLKNQSDGFNDNLDSKIKYSTALLDNINNQLNGGEFNDILLEFTMKQKFYSNNMEEIENLKEKERLRFESQLEFLHQTSLEIENYKRVLNKLQDNIENI